MTGLDDYSTSKKIVDLIRRIAKQEIDKERPAPAYGVVKSVDIPNRRVFVQFPGETSTVGVAMSSPITPLINQVVRVEGITGDRYVTDIIINIGDDGEETPVEPVINWKFWNDDIFDITTDGTQTIKLTYKPNPQSLHVELRGVKARKAVQWTLDGQYLTLTSALDVRAGDVLLTEYVYDAGDSTVSDLILNVPYGSSGWRYKSIILNNFGPVNQDTLTRAYDDSDWAYGKGVIHHSDLTNQYGSNPYTTPFTDGSTGFAGSEAGFGTDIGAPQAGHSNFNSVNGEMVIRRWFPPGVDIVVHIDCSNYLDSWVDDVAAAARSTGNRAVSGMSVGTKTSNWLLAVHAQAGNGLAAAACDIEVTGTPT